MEFKLNGKKLSAFADYSPARYKKYLDSLPDGELLTTNELAARTKAKSNHSMRDIIKKSLPLYSGLIGNRVVFGNPKTIKALKDEIQS